MANEAVLHARTLGIKARRRRQSRLPLRTCCKLAARSHMLTERPVALHRRCSLTTLCSASQTPAGAPYSSARH
jgi:hypothetical protein